MNEFQNAGYGEQQYAPQGFFGGLLGAPLGGLIGRGIGGLLGNGQLGGQIGRFAGGIGGSLLPFGADPVQQAQQQMVQQQLQQQQLQQQLQEQQQLQQLQQLQGGQLAPQGWFGNLIGQVGRPLGGAIGGMFGNAGLGSTIGGVAGQLGSLLPFDASPGAITPQLQQQQQQVMQQHQQLYQQIQQLQQQLQQQQQQYAQLAQLIAQQVQQGQGQIAPQGWFGNLTSSVGQPLGGAIGGMFGNAGLGRKIGGVAGQLGGLLPFGADPLAQAYAQQQMAQQAQQAQQGNSYYPPQGMQYAQQPTLH